MRAIKTAVVTNNAASSQIEQVGRISRGHSERHHIVIFSPLFQLLT